MDKARAAMQQALDIFEEEAGTGWISNDRMACLLKLREALAEQAEHEPMYISESCAERGCACHYSVEVDGEPVAVYSAPVRTKDLTDDEIAAALKLDLDLVTEVEFRDARAVIAADREKNK